LRGSQDRRDGLFVVLEIAQILVAEAALIGGDPLAIVRVLAFLKLVNEVSIPPVWAALPVPAGITDASTLD
jgi:hypothetical protein